VRGRENARECAARTALSRLDLADKTANSDEFINYADYTYTREQRGT